MSKPGITVVLPVHNGEHYIRDAIASVFSQTYCHFELIVLENASQDRTLQIVQSFNDSRLTILPSSTYLSIEQNWQRIRDLPLKEYVTFLCHDDRFHPTYLEKLVGLIEQHPDASLYTTHFRMIGKTNQLLRRCRPVPFQESGEAFLRALQRHQRDSFGTGYAMRSQDFIDAGGFPALPGLMFADDLLFYALSKRSYKVCHPDNGFDYRYHGDSAGRTTALTIIFNAAVMYLEHLQADGYLDDKENRRMALRYVEDTLVDQHRALLIALCERRDKANIHRYQEAIKHLRAHPQWTGDDDLAVKIFSLLLHLFPPLQVPFIKLIRITALLTWKLRHTYFQTT